MIGVMRACSFELLGHKTTAATAPAASAPPATSETVLSVTFESRSSFKEAENVRREAAWPQVVDPPMRHGGARSPPVGLHSLGIEEARIPT